LPQQLRNLWSAPLPSTDGWINNGILPRGGILLLGGPAKIGKTFLLLDMSYSLTWGGRLWGTEYEIREPTTVLYLDYEVGEYEFQRRVKLRPTVPHDNLYYIAKPNDMWLDTRQGIEKLKTEIDAVGAKVVIVDPVSRAMLGHENDNTQVQVLFKHLDSLITSYKDLSIVLSHHFGKPPQGENRKDFDPFSPYNFRGASKWFDACDSLITLVPTGPVGEEWLRLEIGMELRRGPSPKSGEIVLAIGDGGIVRRTTGAKGPLKAAGPIAFSGWSRVK
jgi:RecA-family ATPase